MASRVGEMTVKQYGLLRKYKTLAELERGLFEIAKRLKSLRGATNIELYVIPAGTPCAITAPDPREEYGFVGLKFRSSSTLIGVCETHSLVSAKTAMQSGILSIEAIANLCDNQQMLCSDFELDGEVKTATESGKG